jgi:hypothetical protein
MVGASDEDLANAIHLRREQARLVRSPPHTLALFNECHANAARYVAENPGCRVVRGWFLEDFADFSYFNAQYRGFCVTGMCHMDDSLPWRARGHLLFA